MDHQSFTVGRRAEGVTAALAIGVTALLLALYAVLFDQGLLTGGTAYAHELFHDARHLLGVPCH